MLMQEKLYDFSSDYGPTSVVGDYSPVVVAAAVNLCRNTSSPRTHLNPYECSKYIPLYYTSKIFNDFDKYNQLLAKPTSLLPSAVSMPYLTMQLPIRPSPLTRDQTSVDNSNVTSSSNASLSSVNGNGVGTGFSTLPVKRTLDGSVKSNEPENQRTQSVIMKVEDQRIVEVPTNELINNNRNVTENDEEANICKWTNCYR